MLPKIEGSRQVKIIDFDKSAINKVINIKSDK